MILKSGLIAVATMAQADFPGPWIWSLGSVGQLIVSTAHKSKGREFENVVVLEDFELPSELIRRRLRDPKNTDEADQLINLLYVACTRATHRWQPLTLDHDELESSRLSETGRECGRSG